MIASTDAIPDLRIDSEFRALIPPPTAEELAELEKLLVRDGCRDCLISWDGILLDGHNRLAICQRRGIQYDVKEMEFASRDEAKDWIIRNQLARRNLSPKQICYLRGLQYDAEKRRVGRPEKRTQNECVFPAVTAERTAERLAEEHKVSRETIRRDALFARAVETIAAVLGEDARNVILRREAPGAQESLAPSGFGKNEVIKLAKLAKVNPEQARVRFSAAINGQSGGDGKPKGRGGRRSRERDDQVPFIPASQEKGSERQPSLIEQKTPDDEAWLASFPLRSRVVADRFDEDAILYRRFEEFIRGLKPELHALIGPRSDLGMTPFYRHLLKLSHVRSVDQWQLCDRCDGSGISGGRCRKCHGGGYTIPALVLKGY
jgi:hypothetical protein